MKLPELKRRFKNRYVIRIAAGVLTIAVAAEVPVYTLLMQQRHLQRQRLHRSLPIRKTKKITKMMKKT